MNRLASQSQCFPHDAAPRGHTLRQERTEQVLRRDRRDDELDDAGDVSVGVDLYEVLPVLLPAPDVVGDGGGPRAHVATSSSRVAFGRSIASRSMRRARSGSSWKNETRASVTASNRPSAADAASKSFGNRSVQCASICSSTALRSASFEGKWWSSEGFRRPRHRPRPAATSRRSRAPRTGASTP